MGTPTFDVDALLRKLDGDSELKHYGVPGMKWGVRRSRSQLAQARKARKKKGSEDEGTEVEVNVKPGQRVQARGGSRQPPTDDAIRVASAKQKARASTTDALSTKELQEVVNRMNLEQQYAKLNPPKVSLGKEFAKMVFENDKKKLAETGDWQKTSTYKLGKTALDVANFALEKSKKKKG